MSLCRVTSTTQKRTRVDPLHLIQNGKNAIKIVGPMVRYSKLPFRATCRQYNSDIVYSPMILAREFVRNENARISDFATNSSDVPLIVQVGCNNSGDLLRFVELVKDYCDGVGINCGCPIKEQVREGIGSALIYNPDVLCDMVSSVKQKYGDSVRLETKIRIHENLDQTVELCRRLHKSGVDWITVHGRTRHMRSGQPCDFEAIRYIRDRVPLELPIIANGDCFNMKDFNDIVAKTNVQGVMAARGALCNPALFAGYDKCPWSSIEWLWHYAMEYGTQHPLLQHHLWIMLENMDLHKSQLKELMDLKSIIEMLEWFDSKFFLKRKNDPGFATAVAIPYRDCEIKQEHDT